MKTKSVLCEDSLAKIWLKPRNFRFVVFYSSPITVYHDFLMHLVRKIQAKHADCETKIRAVAGQRSSPDLCFVTKSIKSTSKDIDLIVTQVGCDGTA